MTSKNLLLLGLPSGAWEPRARQLFGDAFATVAIDGWHRLDDDRPCLVLVEAPARDLALALAADPALSAEAWLARWRDDAARLRDLVQRRAARCLVAPAAALWTNAPALLEACRRRFPGQGLPAVPAAATPSPAVDPLQLAIAEATVAADRAARALAAELAASCALPATPGASVGVATAASAVSAAQARLRELTVAARGAEVAAREATGLRERLQRTEVELEQQWLARQAGGPEAEAAKKALATARADKSLLETQVRQLREELETYFVAWQELQQSAGTAGADPSLKIGRSVRLGLRDEDPHRECAFELQDVRHGERSLGTLRLRLVEHHGHAGLVWLPLAGRHPPLQRWHETGREGDQPYLLMIPGDPNTHGGIDQLSATDWHLLNALAARLESIVHDSLEAGERWTQVARRFRQQLAGLPARLRFDDLQVQAAGGGQGLALEFTFDRASCGESVDGPLRLRWRPEGADRDPAAPGTLSVASGPRLWASWPRGADGLALDWLALPLGRATGTPEGRATWQALTVIDRDAALGLVRALPQVVARAPVEAWPAGAPREALRAAAPGVWHETLRRLRSSSVRRAARVLLGRDVSHP